MPPLARPRLAGVVLVLASAAVFAQTGPSSGGGIMLDPFPVVGTRLPNYQVPGSPVVVLDRDLIMRTGSVDLTGLLARLPQTYAGAGGGIGTVPNGSPSYGMAASFFNFTTGAAVPLRQTGVSSVGLRGLGAAGTLVLVDGRRLPLATQEDTANETGAGFYDLSAIPLGLVERVEVLPNGASAVHGSETVGGVVNVVLRRNYVGGEITTGFRGTEHGGGFERHATVSTGFRQGPLNLFVSATGRSREALPATRRTFSASTDQTARGGRNFGLSVGSPAVISATVGMFPDFFDQNGDPARHALVPTNQDGSGLSPADFTGAGAQFGTSATTIRRLDTAPYKDLFGAFEQVGLNLSGAYTFNDRLEAFAQLTWSDRTTATAHEPATVAGGGFGGTNSRVPADDPRNPFNQAVIVSMALVEFPARTQTVDVTTAQAVAGLRGQIGTDWQWDAAVTFARERFDSRSAELDTSAFVAALADGRFNPFGDPVSHGPLNAALANVIFEDARVAGTSEITGFDAFARGPVFELPAGPVSLAVGGESQRAQRHRTSTNPVFGQPAEITSARTTSAVFAEIHAPLSGGERATTGLRRLDARLATRYERADAFTETTPSLGLHWQPFQAFTFSADYTEGFRAPSLTELEDVVFTGTATVTHPVLNGERYPVDTLRGGNPAVEAETSQTYQFGVTFAPPQAKGLSLYARSYETYYNNKLNTLTEQVFVSFENRFPGRVSRDVSGRITQVDNTTVNFGKVYVRAVDIGLVYDHDYGDFGQVRFNVDAARQLDYRTETRPDRAGTATPDGEDTVSPPEWKVFGMLFWNRGVWDATATVQYIDGYASNGSGSFFDSSTAYPSFTTVDLRVGYTFRRGLWRDWGRDARLQIGIGNIADREPPFANSPYGYNQGLHSPLGRTYDLTLRMPF